MDLYDSFNIRSTFFFTGYIAKKFPKVVLLVSNRGHEIASHGLSHLKEHGFDILNYKEQERHLSESKKILEDVSGKEVISFRAPALRVNKFTPVALVETGFKIDSSVASQRFDMFMSFGTKKKLNWLFAPRTSYFTTKDNLAKKGDWPLVELPLSALIIPYLGTTLRIFPKLTRIVRNILLIENKFSNKPIVFDIHPNEFIDESDKKRIIKKRSKRILDYLFKDYLRAQLKARNLGNPAVNLFEKELSYFSLKDLKTVTVKEYCVLSGFLK